MNEQHSNEITASYPLDWENEPGLALSIPESKSWRHERNPQPYNPNFFQAPRAPIPLYNQSQKDLEEQNQQALRALQQTLYKQALEIWTALVPYYPPQTTQRKNLLQNIANAGRELNRNILDTQINLYRHQETSKMLNRFSGVLALPALFAGIVATAGQTSFETQLICWGIAIALILTFLATTLHWNYVDSKHDQLSSQQRSNSDNFVYQYEDELRELEQMYPSENNSF